MNTSFYRSKEEELAEGAKQSRRSMPQRKFIPWGWGVGGLLTHVRETKHCFKTTPSLLCMVARGRWGDDGHSFDFIAWLPFEMELVFSVNLGNSPFMEHEVT